MKEYLEISEYIHWDHPDLIKLAKTLASNKQSDLDIEKSCFEWVRDEIKHSWDYKINPLTCKTSDI